MEKKKIIRGIGPRRGLARVQRTEIWLSIRIISIIGSRYLPGLSQLGFSKLSTLKSLKRVQSERTCRVGKNPYVQDSSSTNERVGIAKILKINERACTLFKDLRVLLFKVYYCIRK